jgi:hypothetical protein
MFFLVGIYRYLLIARRLKAYYVRQKDAEQKNEG